MNRTTRTRFLLAAGAILSALLAIVVTAQLLAAYPVAPSPVAQAKHGKPHHASPTATTTATTTQASATATATAMATPIPIVWPTATPSPVPPAPTATATTTPTPAPTATPSPTPAPSSWMTVLDDQFTSAGIPAHWRLYDGHYGSGPSNNCAAPSQDSAPGDGYLHLIMSYKPAGTCGAGWYEGGMMLSSTYNYREQAVTVRYRIVPSTNSAVYSHHVVPMLWPDDSAYAWYQAEADYCESSSRSSCTTYLHYSQSAQISHSYSVDLTQWHTWRFEQRASTLRVYLDGALVWTYSGTSATLPDALRRLVLQQECPAAGCPPASATGASEDIQIDFVVLQIPG